MSGNTVIELVLVFVIIIAICAIAFPFWDPLIEKANFKADVQRVVNHVKERRYDAIHNSTEHLIDKKTGRIECCKVKVNKDIHFWPNGRTTNARITMESKNYIAHIDMRAETGGVCYDIQPKGR